MSIQSKTNQALAELFPDLPAPKPPESEAEEEKGETEVLPRVNGIIEQDYSARGFHLDVQIDADQVVRTAEILFDLGYFIEAITGVDWIKEKQLEVVYDYSRYDTELCRVAVRTRINREDPHIPTISGIYTGANWHERETHDFFGIVFDGHPNLIPLLLPEDADFHPLLKDFKA